MSDETEVFDPAEIRARRRPLGVLLVFLFELAWAAVVATPLHAWAKRSWGAHPNGDAVLFRPGGRELLAWLGEGDAAASIVVRTTLVLLVVGAVLGQVPLGALIASLCMRGARAKDALSAGIRAWLPLSAMLVLASAVELLVVTGGVFVSSFVSTALSTALGDARAFGAGLAALMLFVVAAAMAGVVADLARVAIVRAVATRTPSLASTAWSDVRAGLRTALTTARRAFGRAFIAWSWRTAVALGLVLLASAAGTLVGGAGGPALVGLFVFHQITVLVRAGLRASWLASALRLVLAHGSSSMEP